MKICRAKWENHSILGNLELNFLKNDGSPYSTIILAGENGTGKTSILDTLYAICNFETPKNLKDITLLGNDGEIIVESTFFDSGNPRGFRATLPDGNVEHWDCARNTYFNNIGTFPKDPRNDGTAYSSAQSVYHVADITSTSASELDKLDLKNTKVSVQPRIK